MTPPGQRPGLHPDTGQPAPAPEDQRWMLLALDQARMADEAGEVPVGAVVVHAGRIIGRGHNRTEALTDPTAHAEIIALSAAACYVHNWRLTGATLYVTAEPCLMCTGAIILARVKRIVFGVRDDKFGACGSVYDIPWDNRLNHKPEVTPGVLAEQSRSLLQAFFARRRESPGSDA